jgi:hypothetical protein
MGANLERENVKKEREQDKSLSWYEWESFEPGSSREEKKEERRKKKEKLEREKKRKNFMGWK